MESRGRTRPSTPYYIYDPSADPPPSYTSSTTSNSSDNSPPSSVSSPRSSLGEASATQRLPLTIVHISDVGLIRERGSHSQSRSSLSTTDDGDYPFVASGTSSDSELGVERERTLASASRFHVGASRPSSPSRQLQGISRRYSSRPPSPAPVGGSTLSRLDDQLQQQQQQYTHYHDYGHSPSSSGVSVASSTSNKGKERARSSGTQSLCNYADYAVPSGGPYGKAYHYRTGPLARKLGSTLSSRDPSLTDLTLLANSPSPSLTGSPAVAHRRRSGWKSPRGKNTDVEDDLGLLLNTSIPLRNRRRFSTLFPFPGAIKAWQRFLRHPLVPTQPLTILFAFALLAFFAYSLTTFMYHVLSPDKAPRPWRSYCQEQRPFPHDLADSLAPVDVFVGVFSVDAAYERRHLIRSTYLRHTRPIDSNTGRPGYNVQVKFILGRPRKHHARRIALEMETYNDIVVLDMKENMNKGKTHTFFKWANENATVPIVYKPPAGKRIGALTPVGDVETYNLGFKKADYVVKADDDAFLILSELERHLRVAPREKAYWGYLIRNLFMAGECYAMSADLVNYVATYSPLEAYTTGAEDKRVAKWMRLHPNASSINWITERCYVYDHPKAATSYSHGFLFPDEVDRVRGEGRTGISTTEKARRGGDHSEAWSSVTKWKRPYFPPKLEMTMEEEVEALIEGGGRWTALEGWTNKITAKDVLKWDSVVFDPTDERIKGSGNNIKRVEQARSDYNVKSESGFGKFNRMPNSLIRDPGENDVRPQHAKRSLLAFWKRADLDVTYEDPVGASPSLESFVANTTASSLSAVATEAELSQGGIQQPIGTGPHFKQGYSLFPDPEPNPDTYRQKSIPAPVARFDISTMSLRERRFLGLSYGGTVVVHYLKRNEWFMETALALLGRHNMWDTGLDALAHPPHIPSPPGKHTSSSLHSPQKGDKDTIISPIPTWNGKGEVDLVSSEWGGARMYGSPLIKENGFVALGRTVPWDALQKSEDAKYGKMKGSSRQRYVNLPENGESSSSSSSEAPGDGVTSASSSLSGSLSSSSTVSDEETTSPTPVSSLLHSQSSSSIDTEPKAHASASAPLDESTASNNFHFQKSGPQLLLLT